MNFVILLLGIALGMLMYGLILTRIDSDSFKDWLKDAWPVVLIIIALWFITVGVFQASRTEYETQGIQKYLSNEIIIDKTQITYDSQNQPIDTTYHVRYRN